MLTIEERFSAALHNAARSWRQALDRRLKYLGVGQASWMAIAVIAKSGQPMSQTELAHKLGVEDPTMVSMIDRLVKAGFVVREPSQTDRRVKLVVLTRKGYKTRSELLEEFHTPPADLLTLPKPALAALQRALETLTELQNRRMAGLKD